MKWEKSYVPLNVLLLLASHVCKAGMAFKIPQLNCSFSAGYFEGTTSFRWGELENNEEIGEGSFGSAVKAKYAPENRTVVVKRFFGETAGKFQERGKESENA